MRAHIVRGALALLLVSLCAVPAEAQRRRVERERSKVEVRVNVPRIRVDLPGGIRVIANDRWYYGSGKRVHVPLNRLRRVAPHAFRRVMRDHRELHRDIRRLHPRRAHDQHERWHRHTGWSHREFVNVERH